MDVLCPKPPASGIKSSLTWTALATRNWCSRRPAHGGGFTSIPAQTRVAIVTCGGLCPGINSVIRSLYLELDFNYGVKKCSACATAIAA